MQNWIKPGVKLIDMCEHLEATVRTLIEEKGLEAGQLNVCRTISLFLLIIMNSSCYFVGECVYR